MIGDEAFDLTVHLAFAFDIGYEIDLEKARPMLAGETGVLARRRRTPESLKYRPAPVRVGVDASGFTLPGVSPSGPIRSELSVFDFGAVSLAIAVPLRLTPAELTTLAGDLADSNPLNTAARLIVSPWLERLKSSVINFAPGELTEEYIIFQLGQVEPGWLEQNAAWVAGLVRLEPGPLSVSEIQEAIRRHISYAPNDLVVLDWAAGLVADRECADTLQVIEFANVQLLEFRFIDDRLDDRLEATYKVIETAGRRNRLRLWFTGQSQSEAARSVRELEVEATSLFERTDNALKLIGDQYLSRVFGLASARFHLDEWQQSIRRKLETVGDVADLLVEQGTSRRMEVLEVIIVLLIAVEIALTLSGH